ncbi:MAG: hypothetical protein ACR650_09845 [Methylocystis sp.]
MDENAITAETALGIFFDRVYAAFDDGTAGLGAVKVTIQVPEAMGLRWMAAAADVGIQEDQLDIQIMDHPEGGFVIVFHPYEDRDIAVSFYAKQASERFASLQSGRREQ